MATQTIKTNVRRGFEEGINQRNLALFDELLAATYVNHSLPAPMPGPDGMKAVVGMFLSAFPDMQVTVQAVLAEGDKVATRGYFSGTHQGDFQGIPPTGKTFKAGYMDLWRADADGKFVENWVQMDMMGLLQQLGVIPTPG